MYNYSFKKDKKAFEKPLKETAFPKATGRKVLHHLLRDIFHPRYV